MKKTSSLPELSLEWQTLTLEPAETCEHEFQMYGLRTIQCTKCLYGLTGLTVREAERIIAKRRKDGEVQAEGGDKGNKGLPAR